MKRLRALTLAVAMVAGMTLAQVAMAGPDPHGHGGGKDQGGGKPSPSPTVEVSPTAEPAPAPEPVASESSAPNADPSDPAAAAPTEDPQSSDAQGGGSGIIKLDRSPFDQAPNNEPHVGCTFQMDFYNYPEGGLRARYQFSLWNPTGHAELKSGALVLEDDPAGGGQDLDGEETVELGAALIDSGAEPHQHNGWHVKLVVYARHTSGPDQKQKVFWVRECQAPETTAPPTVLPSTVTPPAPVAFTGSQIARLGAFGLLALVLGSGALWFSARLRRERP